MIAALVIIAVWQAFTLLVLLAGARLGVLRVTVTRPARPKTTEGGKP